MNLTELMKQVSNDVWGFVPNRDIKPVHLANGLFRALYPDVRAASLLHKAAGGFRRGKATTTSEQLLHDLRHKELLVSDNETKDLEYLNDLRSALDLVLNQDKALYPTSFYSLTLTHKKHVSRDPSGQQAGRFLAKVLFAAENRVVVETLRDTLEQDSDNIYLLTAPLLERDDPGLELHPEPAPTDPSAQVGSPALKHLQDAFERLSKHQPYLEKTIYLRRFVLLSCFGIFLHLINAGNQKEDERPLVPILLAGVPTIPTIREASRATFVRAKRQIETAFEQGVLSLLKARGQANLSDSAYIDLVTKGPFTPKKDGTADVFAEDYRQERLGVDNPAEAFARAATRACFGEESSDPTRFATSIGRLSGLVFPRQGGPGEKYYRVAPQLLDTLTASLLEPGEELPLEEFWERAQECFGLLAGARSYRDADTLRRWGIRQVPTAHLKRNAGAVLEELQRMGHARRFADGVTLIKASVPQ